MPHTVLALTRGWIMKSAVLKNQICVDMLAFLELLGSPVFISPGTGVVGMHQQAALDFILLLFVVLGLHRHCNTSQTTSSALSLFNLARTISIFSKATV